MSCKLHGAGGEVPPGKKSRALSCSVILPAVCGNCRSVNMKVVLSFGLVVRVCWMFFFNAGYENPQSALGFHKCAFQACMGAIQRVGLCCARLC